MLSSSKIVVCTLSKIEVSHVIYATAAQSLQSCPTLCDPIDGLLPGSSVPRILQNTGVGCHFLLQYGRLAGLHLIPLIPFAISLVQSLQSCPTLCDPMNRSTPGLPVHHHLPEFTRTHVHRVSDATQPSHPLSSPSPPAPNPSQHQGLFQWVNSLHEVAKVLEFQL